MAAHGLMSQAKRLEETDMKLNTDEKQFLLTMLTSTEDQMLMLPTEALREISENLDLYQRLNYKLLRPAIDSFNAIEDMATGETGVVNLTHLRDYFETVTEISDSVDNFLVLLNAELQHRPD